jgi:hypothetical protein
MISMQRLVFEGEREGGERVGEGKRKGEERRRKTGTERDMKKRREERQR